MSWRGGGGRRPHWSNNEFLAHKKNVGEEARLLGQLDLIRRRKVLATSGLETERRRVLSDLRHVRTSTGHSVDALPPTPFRLHRTNPAVGGHRTFYIQNPQSPASPSPQPSNHHRLPLLLRDTATQRQDTARGAEEGEAERARGRHEAKSWGQEVSSGQAAAAVPTSDLSPLPTPCPPSPGGESQPSGRGSPPLPPPPPHSPVKQDPEGGSPARAPHKDNSQYERAQQRAAAGGERRRRRRRRGPAGNSGKEAGDESPKERIEPHPTAKQQRTVGNGSSGAVKLTASSSSAAATTAAAATTTAEGAGLPMVRKEAAERNQSSPASQTRGNFASDSENQAPETINRRAGLAKEEGEPPGVSKEVEGRSHFSRVINQTPQGSGPASSSGRNQQASEEGSLSPRKLTGHRTQTHASRTPTSDLTRRGQGRRYSVEFKEPEVHDIKRYSPRLGEHDDLREEDTTLVPGLLEEDAPVTLLSPRHFYHTTLPPQQHPHPHRQASTTAATPGLPEEEEEEGADQGMSGRRRSSATTCITPMAQEIGELLDSVRQKNEELLAVKAAVLTLNSRTRGGHRQPDQQTLHDQLKLLKVQSRRSALRAPLPNTRYKCRTCLERVRDNQRYRHSFKMQASSQRRTSGSGAFPPLPAKDLEGNVIPPAAGSSGGAWWGMERRGELGEDCGELPVAAAAGNKESPTSTRPTSTGNERGRTRKKSNTDNDSDPGPDPDADSDADAGHPHHHQCPKGGGARGTGYSRARLERLAQPKGGGKPRVNISGSVLRRQAEVLRRPHRDVQMSEREQERVLRLQSRVRLFLALLQRRQAPGSMVHIPQRDDIMQVDISHIVG